MEHALNRSEIGGKGKYNASLICITGYKYDLSTCVVRVKRRKSKTVSVH